MKAKSDDLRAVKPKRNNVRRHLPYDLRRAQILDKAIQFFAEYGLTGQTRHLAAACGVSQRLLYRYFPNKAALLDEVYREAIVKPFDPAWLDDLENGEIPLRERLTTFYTRYANQVLTRRWLRLFLYSSLAETPMVSSYADAIVKKILNVVVTVATRDLALTAPARAADRQRIGWMLHGAVVMAGIRVHIYGISSVGAWHREIDLWVDTFLASLPDLCAEMGEAADNRRHRNVKSRRARAGSQRLPGAAGRI